jgi:hypothetical protein
MRLFPLSARYYRPSLDERYEGERAMADRLVLRTAVYSATRHPDCPGHVRQILLEAYQATRLPR